MKLTVALIALTLVLIAGWTQREYIGSELGLTSPSEAVLQIDTSRIVTRRVWAGPGVDLTGSPSPDGTFLDWTTGDLAIRDLAAGEPRHLTNKGPWSESVEMAIFSAVSHDGQHIADSWLDENVAWEVRIIRVDGSEERVVVGPSLTWLQPHDWSQDGRQLLIRVVDTSGVNRLRMVPVEGGEFRSLAAPRDGRSPLRAIFSPDGRFVVFDDRADGDPPQMDAYVVPVDGGRSRVLVEHPANDVVFGWSADGSAVLFASDRTGNLDHAAGKSPPTSRGSFSGMGRFGHDRRSAPTVRRAPTRSPRWMA